MESDRCAVVCLFQAGHKPKEISKMLKMPRGRRILLLGPLRDIWRLGMLKIGPGVDVRVVLL